MVNLQILHFCVLKIPDDDDEVHDHAEKLNGRQQRKLYTKTLIF